MSPANKPFVYRSAWFGSAYTLIIILFGEYSPHHFGRITRNSRFAFAQEMMLEMLLAEGDRKMLHYSHTMQYIFLVVSHKIHEWSAHTQIANGRLIHNSRMVGSYTTREWSACTQCANGRLALNSRMVGPHIIHAWSSHTQFTNGRLTHNSRMVGSHTIH